MTKTIQVPDELHAKIAEFGKDCNPEQTVDETAKDLLKLGIEAQGFYFILKWAIRHNPNYQ